VSARLLRQSLHSFHIPPFVPKIGELKDPISTSITLCWCFPFFSFSCSTKINSVDLFWLHVEFTCVTRRWKNTVSPRDQKLPAFTSSLASGLVTVDLRLNTLLSIGRRWDSTSTSLQTLLTRDVRRFWMPSCLCATNPPFCLHYTTEQTKQHLEATLEPSSPFRAGKKVI